jgi:hypothetical protein
VNPGGGLITMVNAQLRADPDFVQRIRELHAAETPLLDMVDQLGLGASMTEPVRAILRHLSPDDVAAIRRATLDMLDRAENQMPVDCNLSQRQIDEGAPVTVAVVPNERGNEMIKVRPA